MMLYRSVLGPCLMPSQGRPLLSIVARWPVRTRTPHINSLAPAKVILCTTGKGRTPLFRATGAVPQRTRSSVLCDGPVSLASLSPAFRHSNGPVPAFQHYRSFATSANTEKAARDDESYMETINRYWKLLQEGRRGTRAGKIVRTGVIQLAQKAGLLSATRPDPDLPSEVEHLVRTCTESGFLTNSKRIKILLRHYSFRTGATFGRERYNKLIEFLQKPEIQELLGAADDLSKGLVDFPPACQTSADSDETSHLIAIVKTYLADVEAIPQDVEDVDAFLTDAANTYDAATKAPPVPFLESLSPSRLSYLIDRFKKSSDSDFYIAPRQTNPETGSRPILPELQKKLDRLTKEMEHERALKRLNRRRADPSLHLPVEDMVQLIKKELAEHAPGALEIKDFDNVAAEAYKLYLASMGVKPPRARPGPKKKGE